MDKKRSPFDFCRAGIHDLTDPKNVRLDTKGRRRGCAQCSRDKALARYYKRKAERSA